MGKNAHHIGSSKHEQCQGLKKESHKRSPFISFTSGSNISGSLGLNVKSTDNKIKIKIGNALVTYSALFHADI